MKKRISNEQIEQAWQMYQVQRVSLQVISQQLGYSISVLSLHLSKIPGYKALAKQRIQQTAVLNGAKTPHNTNAYRLAVQAIWQDKNKSSKQRTLLRKRLGDDIRFRDDFSEQEVQSIINKFKQLTPILQLVKQHDSSSTVITKILKSHIELNEYKDIVKQILTRNGRKRQQAMTNAVNRKAGQPGNKKSKTPHSRHTFGVKWPR